MSSIEMAISRNKGSIIQYFQNLSTYSEQLDNVAYVKSNAAIEVNDAEAPDETLTADKFTPNNGSIGILHRQYSGLTISPAHYISYHAKYSDLRYVFIWHTDLFARGFVIEFDLLLGTFRTTYTSNDYAVYADMQKDRNGFYRLTTASSIPFSTIWTRLYVSDVPHTNESSGTPLYIGDGVKGLHVWGVQLANDENVLAYTKTEDSIVSLFSESTENSIISNIKESNIEIDTRN
ncbi:hypothetical protein KAR91_47725 [Candidatus Pacearchaeota archaeon]|nr:hypothetical protein [Candidatus Pacearchaeota archaeon]